MTDILSQAQDHLLAPANIEAGDLSRVLDSILGHNIDAADLYFQSTRHEAWVLEDSIVKEGSFNVDGGVGVRAISGEKTGFAYSNEIVVPALEQAAGAARSIARQGQQKQVRAWGRSQPLALYPTKNPLDSMTREDKVALLKAVDQEARKMDSRVKQVTVSLAGVHEVVMVAASDGTLAGDIRPLVRLNVSVIAEHEGRIERGSAGGGGRGDYQQFLLDGTAKGFAREAVRQALVNLEAVPAPAGGMPVVLAAGWSGVLLHEAVGHGLEGDFNRKGSSAYAGRIGERVASPLCTIVDDGTLDGRRGSLNMDDEGVPTESTVLIENGILKGYMQDKLNARLMGVAPTGNGRRESYSHLPMPRMTNTYMLAGAHDPDEIIASVDRGIYVSNMGGGQVDITSGKFVFSTSEAYLIENGKVTTPVKGATLIGNGPDVMNQVSMVGNNLELDTGIGVCGKDGQSVPVGVGQPTLKIDDITVGGTA
ncbi:protease TldD [Endozoicomonas montiporae]|uniref:Protease TldD n=2 Tax=Endozoicomonas montiporae TaxID=1027273 RepID=A0A081N5E1_9GAMM|nr:metalloprotease TldD [Endozoicomonas montiporae]AMO57452.1 protease TldD [Endozoicomonas montiporae CL-33]KEQ13664.1 protease TldD [Endozoicomonas montiporae]